MNMFEIAQYLVDHPKEASYKGYMKLSIHKEGSKTKVSVRNRDGGVFIITLPKPANW